MSGKLTIKGKYFPLGKKGAQMVERPSISEAELEHRPRQVRDKKSSNAKTFPLGRKASNKAIQSAHGTTRKFPSGRLVAALQLLKPHLQPLITLHGGHNLVAKRLHDKQCRVRILRHQFQK